MLHTNLAISFLPGHVLCLPRTQLFGMMVDMYDNSCSVHYCTLLMICATLCFA